MEEHSYKIIIESRAIPKYNGMMKNFRGQIYSNPKVKVFESIVKEAAKKQFNRKPLTGKLHVFIDFEFENNVMGDLFNLPKAVCDALNKVIWEDDRQIIYGYLSKKNTGRNKISLKIVEI